MRRPSKTILIVAAASILSLVALVRGPLKTPLQVLLSTAPPDGYRYTESEGITLLGGDGRYQVMVPFHRQIWIGSDGSGRLVETRGKPGYYGPNDLAEWEGAVPAERIDEVYGPQTLTYLSLSDLPRDPSRLRAYLVAHADRGQPTASEIFTLARGLLWETVPPPELARALKKVLVSEQGITVEPREGNAVSLALALGDPPELRLTMVLSEEGTLLREERMLLVAAPSIDAPPPVPLGYTDYLAAQVVDHLPVP